MSLRFRVLGSGSTGNATLVEGAGTRILIDAGLGPRTLAERLVAEGIEPESIEAILLSHEHSDHARGAAAFSAKWGVRIIGTRGTYAAAGFGAEDVVGYEAMDADRARFVGNLHVEAIPLPHDAAEPIGFVVSCGSESLGHATDFGHVSRRLADAFRQCTALLLESNYDDGLLRNGPYPWALKDRILSPVGHLSNAEAAFYLERDLSTTCRRVVLAHLSQHNNDAKRAASSARAALERGGRGGVEVLCAASEGTAWIETSGPRPIGAAAAAQMRLF